MAVRGSAHRRIVGNPLAGVMRDLDRTAKAAKPRRRGSVVGGEVVRPYEVEDEPLGSARPKVEPVAVVATAGPGEVAALRAEVYRLVLRVEALEACQGGVQDDGGQDVPDRS